MKKAMQEELKRILERYARAWTQRSKEDLDNLLARQARCVTADGLHLVGRRSIVGALTASQTNLHRDSQLSIRPTHAKLLSDALALVHATWGLAGQRGINDRLLPPRSGILTAVLERQNGSWFILAYHETAIPDLRELSPTGG
jgi:uncharacterized protein (TIGR02246 family)